MGSLLARAYKRILSGKLAQDAGEHWVTVNAGSKEGGEGGGSHVLLDGEGRVVAGMGGKFKGQNTDRIERKKFINQNAWNRQRKALTEKASDTERSVNHLHVKALMDPEKSINWHTAVGQKNLEKVLDRSKADTTGMGLINKLHTGIDAETELMRIDKEQKERAREEELKKLDETIKREQARREYLASPEGQAEEKRNRLKKEVAYRKNERLKEQQRQDELQKLIRGDRKDFADQNLHTPEAQAFYFGTFNKLSWGLAQKSTEERNRILADARAEYEKVKGDISEKTRASIDEHLAYLDRATAIIDRLRKNTQKQQETPKAEEPKADRKSLIGQVNARHTMPMGDIIARKEQAITDKINNSNLSEEDKKKYLDKLNSLTDEALKAGAGSLDLYKVGVSYKKTNAESNAFNKMFSKQSEIDNLEKEINKKVQDNVTQAENKNTLNSLNEAESTGAVYFKDANGKEFYRANSKSKTWYQIDQYNQAKGEKAKAKQEALNAKKQQETPKAEEQPKLNTKIDHSSVINDIADRVRDQYNQNGRLFDARTELRKQLSNLKDGTYVTYSKDIILRKKGDELLFNSKRFGWTASGTPTDFFFDGNKLKLGVGDTPEEAKANYKETEVIDEAKGATVRKENAEKEQARKQAEKAEREERSKDFYLNKIDKIKDRISNGENYSAGLYKSELYKSLLAKANHGNTEEVNRVLNELKKEGIYTDKHRIWGLADVAKKNADYITERHEKADKTTTALKGATVNKEVYNGEARTSVKFDNIPNYATRVALKQNGFKWNADAGEWYKSEGENGTAHESIVNALKDQGFNEQPKTDAPTGQQTEEQPRGLKNAFSDKYQKIDNSNLNKYQKVDNISNNKNTENGVTNMNIHEALRAKTPANLSKADIEHGIDLAKNSGYAPTAENVIDALNQEKHYKLFNDLVTKSKNSIGLSDIKTATALKALFPNNVNTSSDWTAYNHKDKYEPSSRLAGYDNGKKTKPYNDLVNREGNIVMFKDKKTGEESGYGLVTKMTPNGTMMAHIITPDTHANISDYSVKQGDTDVNTYIKNKDTEQRAKEEQAYREEQQSKLREQIAKHGKQYHGTGIENKNGRYEISFNAFPSYELRTDMKNNGFRWDPNAKVWHTTDREKLDQVMSKHFTERT